MLAGALVGLPASLPAAASAPGTAASAPDAPSTASVAGAPAAAALPTEDRTPGLRYVEDVVYAVDLAGAAVHVTHTITLTNEVPNRVTDAYVERTYWPEIGVPVLVGATGLSARSDGRVLSVRTGDSNGYVVAAVIDLVPDLYFGDTQTVTLTYDLPQQPPRSGAAAQVNTAFATFPVFTSADPGLASVTVTLPRGVGVEVVGSPLQITETPDAIVLSGSALPDDFFATIVARDDDALVSRDLTFGDALVRVQAWPGDDVWLDFASDLLDRGLPALETAIGIDWPVDGRLDVVETVSPYVYGYAGWYDPSSRLIEVGDALDAHVMLHEVAHAWFNQGLFEGRWINEALAEEFAALAMVDLGMERPVPDGAPGPGQPLNEWGNPTLDAPETDEREAHGYAASWWVARTLVEEIGPEAMADVVQAAAAQRSPYAAATSDDRLRRVADWRTFLDLLQEVGGSADAEQVFRDLVVAPSEVPLLDERAAAREAYARLVAAGGGWAPPAFVRGPMADWDFAAATAAMPAAAEGFERRDAVLDLLGDAGELGLPVQEDVEAAASPGELADLLDRVEAAAEALVAADAAVGGANPLARLGMLVVDAETDLAAARAALRDGAYESAADAARGAEVRVGTATVVGGGLVAAVLLLVLVLVALVLRRRRGRGVPPPPVAWQGTPPPPPAAWQGTPPTTWRPGA